MNKVLVSIVALVATAIAILAWYAGTHSSLFLANGLPVPVQVSLDGQPAVEVEAESYLSLGSQSDGQRVIEVRRGDVVIERETVTLSTTSVFNILGAAPIAVDVITYTSSSADAVSPNTSYLCGVSLVSQRVSFLFEEPPQSISLAKGSTRETRTLMRLAEGGFITCLEKSAPAQVAELSDKVATAMPERADLKQLALHALVRAGQPQRALNEARQIADTTNTVDGHRTLQHVFVAAGMRESAVAEYAERHRRAPTAESAYLWARLLDATKAVPLLRESLEKWPDDARLHRALAWNLDALALWAESLAETTWAFEQPRSEEPMDPLWLKLRVRALVALGRADEALTTLSESLPAEADLEDLAMLDRVSRAAGRDPTPTAWERFRKGRNETSGLRYFFDVMVGRKPQPLPALSPNDGFRSVAALANHDPEGALASFRPLNFDSSTPLSPEASFLLLGEAWRKGSGPALPGLERSAQAFPCFSEVRDFVRRGDHLEGLNDLPGELRAALWLARARSLEEQGQTAAAKSALAQVAAADPLRGLAVAASVHWPAVKPTARPGAFELRLLPGVVLSPASK